MIVAADNDTIVAGARAGLLGASSRFARLQGPAASRPKGKLYRECAALEDDPAWPPVKRVPHELPSSGRLLSAGLAGTLQFEGYEPGQNRRRIELANDVFDTAKTSGERVHGNDIAVAGRCQGDKAQIK
jgi:hypothetical protein